MRTALLAFLGSFLVSTAHAEVGTQVIAKVTGSTLVSEKVDVGVFGSMFVAPGTDPLYFTYVGPGLQVTQWWWTSPRVGMVMNLPAYGDALPIVSWWNNFTVRNFSLFTETEVYPNMTNSDVTYYGYYSFDLNLALFTFGAHVEQVNLTATEGPHVLLNFGDHLSAGVEHHWAGTGAGTFRAIVTLKFNN